MNDLSEEELAEVVELVWMTALELPVEAGSATALEASDHLTASIAISGAWDGKVRVRASQAFLSHAAATMFTIGSDEVEQQDRVDTLTELTNMLGGSVKCLLPETCDLALPLIVAADADDLSNQDWVFFSSMDQPLAVAVVPADTAASAAA
ncbi:MAG: chemotaxis protein CheX [Granulosicoccus sp.]|nr:chemotaxis protein CheX [Granulosicoccus sp.]